MDNAKKLQLDNLEKDILFWKKQFEEVNGKTPKDIGIYIADLHSQEAYRINSFFSDEDLQSMINTVRNKYLAAHDKAFDDYAKCLGELVKESFSSPGIEVSVNVRKIT